MYVLLATTAAVRDVSRGEVMIGVSRLGLRVMLGNSIIGSNEVGEERG